MLGICLGMQLLFEYSQEFGYHRGLGLIKGGVIKLAANEKSVDFRIPHMGWNKLVITPNSAGCPLLQNVADGSFVYFVHSYKACAGKDNLVAYTEYGEIISAVVQNKAVYGTQFHPEKSEEVGLEILRSFFKSV
ncbi:Imidazole glycerol phosphate synthase subunit HisH [bioreactor metagenome]|uniref:Imidazole glycerol phosphate synthase subunit HisH n=1 Tax=bioreactor metagenome TaxID=1076179 RepID=A0A645GBV5_9ZZZZ